MYYSQLTALLFMYWSYFILHLNQTGFRYCIYSRELRQQRCERCSLYFSSSFCLRQPQSSYEEDKVFLITSRTMWGWFRTSLTALGITSPTCDLWLAFVVCSSDIAFMLPWLCCWWTQNCSISRLELDQCPRCGAKACCWIARCGWGKNDPWAPSTVLVWWV